MEKGNQTKIRRIKAGENSKKTVKSDKVKQVSKKDKKEKKEKRNAPKWLQLLSKPFVALGRYFKGSWHELKLTKWPNRRTTWTMTLAVLIFCAFFAVLILVADFAFEELTKLILERGV